MKWYQSVMVNMVWMLLILVFLGGAGTGLVLHLLREIDAAWALAATSVRTLGDTRPGRGLFLGRLTATTAHLAPSGAGCGLWEAEAIWYYKTSRKGTRSVSCTRSGIAPGLALTDGSVTVPIVSNESPDIVRTALDMPGEQPLQAIQLRLQTQPREQEIPSAMVATCGPLESPKWLVHTSYTESCLPLGSKISAISCKSVRGLEPCTNSLVLMDHSLLQQARNRLADQPAGERLLLSLASLLGLLIFAGLFQKLYPIPPPRPEGPD